MPFAQPEKFLAELAALYCPGLKPGDSRSVIIKQIKLKSIKIY